MTDQALDSLPTTVQDLNLTPLSRNVIRLLMEAGEPPLKGLAVVRLLELALERKMAEPAWAQEVVDAAHLAEKDDPQATYWNLSPPQLETAQDLDEAILAVLREAADRIPQDSEPA